MASSYRRSSQSFANYIVGLGLVVLAALLFFLTDNRALNDYEGGLDANEQACLLYTSPSPRDRSLSRMPSSA